MSQYTEGAVRDFPNTAAIGKHLRVKSASGVLAVAGLTDRELGTLEQAMFASSVAVNAPVRLRTAQGTVKMVAAGAITAFAQVNTAAGGKVDDAATATGYPVGTALEEATADGDIIEVLRNSHGDTALS